MLVNKQWLLTPERALVHLATATAIVADMHLGYCEARQGAGEAVPVAEFDDTLAIFELLKSRHRILRVVVAGDLVENRSGLEVASRLHFCLRDMDIELTVVPGNHDRGLETFCLPVQERVTVGGWRIVHGSGPLPRGRVIVGHYHPALPLDGRHLPCFLIGRRHMILPAFSQDATGGWVSRRGTSRRNITAPQERDTRASGGPGIPAWPFDNAEVANWQAVAIVGNSLVATRPNSRPSLPPATKAPSVSSRA